MNASSEGASQRYSTLAMPDHQVGELFTAHARPKPAPPLRGLSLDNLSWGMAGTRHVETTRLEAHARHPSSSCRQEAVALRATPPSPHHSGSRTGGPERSSSSSSRAHRHAP